MDSDLTYLGPRLRAARKARGLTLEELSRRSAVSVSTLSRLESGKRQASLELLIPITRQLGVRIDDLIDNEPRDPRVRRPVIRRDGIVMAPLSPEGSPLHAFKITYPPAATSPSPRVHAGNEWLYVVSGRLRLLLGDQELELVAGEAAEFATETPHAMSALGGQPAEIISIFGDDGFTVHTTPTD